MFFFLFRKKMIAREDPISQRKEKTQQPTKLTLVGGLEHLLFFHILVIIIPTDELIFFRGVGIPPTRSTHNKNTGKTTQKET